ncbi:MAG: PQQ-dependent sugar dehydrogenase [Ignavibacteria bacterium]|nr:PQQ-dependent sugar dehydrogenase [Ignavibacteria bacterium]
MLKIIVHSLLFILFTFISNNPSNAQYIPIDAFPNLTVFKPTELTQSPDGSDRFFIVSQTGQIRVFKNFHSASNSDMKMFLDIELVDSVTQSGFQGVYTMAFHPNFASNRYFYVYYSVGSVANMVNKVARFTVSANNPDSALPSSKLDILSIPYNNSEHNGGKMAFGNDGFLYISLGDGSPGSGGDPENRAQNKSDLRGKILRIDVNNSSGGNNYSIPVTNPFYNNASGFRQEIYALGFRNVWKFEFDYPTNTLWAADVGQGRMEEIDTVINGGNYGWRYKEGTLCFNPPTGCDTIPGLINPIFEYPHNIGLSITGGYVYRGRNMPGLVNKYIYADYILGKVWALTYQNINPPTSQLLFDVQHYITDFAIDTAKNLYYVNYGFSSSPKIYKIIDTNSTYILSLNTAIPENNILYQNYPNPFNPTTEIKFSITKSGIGNLSIYDVNGKLIDELVNTYLKAGTYSVKFNLNNKQISSGILFYKLTSENFSETKKMVIVK